MEKDYQYQATQKHSFAQRAGHNSTVTTHGLQQMGNKLLLTTQLLELSVGQILNDMHYSCHK